MADQYREHLRAEGITRPVLFKQCRGRQRIRLHDTWATFVTVSLANGMSEAWVQDRTGHRSSNMIAKYRRAARMAAEVGMAPFVRMDVAVGLEGISRIPRMWQFCIDGWQRAVLRFFLALSLNSDGSPEKRGLGHGTEHEPSCGAS